MTYKVVNGTWADGSTDDKTEVVLSGASPASVPMGMVAGEGFTGGLWDVDPSSATIVAATTFSYTFDAELEVYGVVEWVDNDDELGGRPERVTVRLMANGEEASSMEVAAGAAGLWTFSFDHLAPRDPQGREIAYSIAADDVPEYTVEVVNVAGSAYRITYSRPTPVKPTLTVTAKDQTYTYNGQIQGEGDTVYEDPAEIAEKVTVEGLQDGDELTSIIIDGQGTDADDYDLAASNASIVNASGDNVTDNYVINYVLGTLTIEPAKVTITLDSVSKMEGDSDPAFTGTVEGLIADGDLGEIKFVRTGGDEAPGTYEGVLTATYTENPNYEVTVIPGDFTIEGSTPEPVEKGILTFDLAGGTLNGKTGTITIEANVGDTIKLPSAPTREGYTFQYWKGSMYEAGADYKVEGDHTFTAVWEENKAKTYTVTFDANGHGTAPASQTVEEGKKASKPADPKTSGYTFGGWFTDKECKNAYSFDTAVTKDVTLYAKWTKNSSSSGGNSGSSPSTSGKTAARTGDESNVGLWVMLMAASLLTLVFIVSRRRFVNR